MAHECPECGLTCHCRGDIDDLLLNVPKYVNACCHCPMDGIPDDEWEYFDPGGEADQIDEDMERLEEDYDDHGQPRKS